jgi:ABC-type multidrug transport system fused ATPase/permease subunit
MKAGLKQKIEIAKLGQAMGQCIKFNGGEMEMDMGQVSNKYLFLYIGLTVTLGVFSFSGNLLLTRFALSPSKTPHEKLLNSPLKTKMLFFETTPQGRIVNRLSKDTDAVDSNLLRFS